MMHLLSRGLEPETSNPHTSRLFTSVYVTSVACQGDAGTSRWAVSLSGCRGRSELLELEATRSGHYNPAEVLIQQLGESYIGHCQ